MTDMGAIRTTVELVLVTVTVMRECRTQEERLGPELLAEISSRTGASACTLDIPTTFPRSLETLRPSCATEHILGYSPDGSRRDGRWRKIKVRLAVPHDLPHYAHRQGRGTTAH